MPQRVQNHDSPIELYSVNHVIELSGTSRFTIYSELRAGRLESVKIGTRRLIPNDAYHQWINDLRSDGHPAKGNE